MINEDIIYVIIGSRIKNKRESKGLSQSELAKAIKVSRSSLANYESGKQSIYISDLYLIADYLSIDIHELIPTINEIKEYSSPTRLLDKDNKLKENDKKEIIEFIEKMEQEG